MIIKSGRPIGYGLNKAKLGITKDKRYDKSNHGFSVGIHAELDAVLNAVEGSMKGSIIYISIITRGENFALSKPCERCYELLKEHGIKKAIYHDSKGEAVTLEII